MNVVTTVLSGVLILEPELFDDARGSFFESFNQRDFNEVTGTNYNFVQDNHSYSTQWVLRGLHYQVHRPQGKLVSVVKGRVFDVAVDLRRSSPNFGRWVGAELSDVNHRQHWIPPGFAHGFLTMSESADVIYKVTDYYAPEYERCVLWSDPELDIDWPLNASKGELNLSVKDTHGLRLSRAETYA